MTIHDIMQMLVDKEGSDIHIVVGSPPIVRIDGELLTLNNVPALNEAQAQDLIVPIMTQEQKDYVKVNKELDFGF